MTGPGPRARRRLELVASGASGRPNTRAAGPGMRLRRHPDEADRLGSLRSYRLLDTAPTGSLDALTRLAAQLMQVPTAVINLIDDQRQWALSRYGPAPLVLPRGDSVCSDVVAAGEPLTVPDLTRVPRYAGLSWVIGPGGIRAYAGTPLIGRDGLPIGTLSVLDTDVRVFTPDQLRSLHDLGGQVVAVLELRRSDATHGLASPALVPEATDPTALRRAFDDRQFVAHYQPLVDLRDGTVTGLEALLRWQHPTRGLLTPDAFLSGLEAGSLAGWTSRVTMEAAFTLIAELRTRGVDLHHGVALNVSSRQLSTPHLAERVLKRLAGHGLPGTALTAEITETSEITDVGFARQELLTLRDAGVRVVADDFGVGWSNLARLLQLPLSGLKIDRQLVTGMVGDRVRDYAVASVVHLGAALGLDVIAEGIETEAVRDRLLELGCHRGQGWLYGRALPAAAVPTFLMRRSAERSGRPAD